jgi:hypothetical protein
MKIRGPAVAGRNEVKNMNLMEKIINLNNIQMGERERIISIKGQGAKTWH